MQFKKTLSEVRNEMRLRLQQWLPHDEKLVNKELQIFDHLMSRRAFLKQSAVLTSATLFNYQALSDDNLPPSQWEDAEYSPITLTEKEKKSVEKVSKIRVDADIMDSLQSYSPLPAPDSESETSLLDSTILESFNPHVLTVDDEDEVAASGLNDYTRNYGNPEFIHLIQSAEGADYELKYYEQASSGKAGLKEFYYKLENTGFLNLNRVVAANGNFHNRVHQANAYYQKMVVLTDTESINSPLWLGYQFGKNALVQSNEPVDELSPWQTMDLMEYFAEHEHFEFSSVRVLDIDTFHDGMNHSFIYGTLLFDDLYSYGFVITSNEITDTAPEVSFFTAHFLSMRSNAISTFANDYESVIQAFSAQGGEVTPLTEFSIFSGQRYIPFVHLVDENNRTGREIVFTYKAYDTTHLSAVINNNDDINKIFIPEKSTVLKRYFIAVNAASAGVQYLLEDIDIAPEIVKSGDGFEVKFDTQKSVLQYDAANWGYNIGPIIFTRDIDKTLKSTFVRSVKQYTENNQTFYHVINVIPVTLPIPSINEDLGLLLNSVIVKPWMVDGVTLDVAANKIDYSIVDGSSTSFNNKSYQETWFNKMAPQNSRKYGYSSLESAVSINGGEYDFFCTQNHQGLLRSYFIITFKNDDDSSYRYLISFNESIPDTSTASYGDKTHDQLYEEILNDNVVFDMPLPIALNPKELHKWYSFVEDNEIIYTAKRGFSVDENKKLIPNTDVSLLGYRRASSDPLDGTWTTYEQEIQTDIDNSAPLYQTTKHQVNLFVNNIYDYSASLGDTLYIEITFSRPVSVTDYTDPDNPKYYHLGRFSSLFAKPDETGRVALEINAGMNEDDMLKGALLMYRLFDAADFTIQADAPLAVLSQLKGDTSEFEYFNLSYKQLERLSTVGANQQQEGAPENTDTPQQIFEQHVKSGAKNQIKEFTDTYGQIYDQGKPNTDAIRSVRSSYRQIKTQSGAKIVKRKNSDLKVSRLTHIAVIRTGGMAPRISWGDIKRTVSSPVNSLSNVISSAVSELEDVGGELVDGITSALNDVLAGIGDIPIVGTAMANAIVFVSSKFVMILKEVISIAKLVWELLKGILDLSACWDIGQELKKIYNAQFQLNASYPNNAFAILSGQTHAPGLSPAPEVNNNPLTFSESVEINTIPANLQQEDSVKQNYVFDQISRNTPIADINNSLPSGIPSIEIKNFVESYLDLLMKIATGQANLSDSSGSMHDILFNQVYKAIKTGYQGTFETSQTIIQEQMINQNPLGSSFESFSKAENILYGTLSTMLFFNPLKLRVEHQFKDFQDVAFFVFGFVINALGIVLKPILDIDFRTEIRNGNLRKIINNATVAQPKISKSTDEDLDKAIFICGIADVLNDILMAGLFDTKKNRHTSLGRAALSMGSFLSSLFILPKLIKMSRKDNHFGVVTYQLGVASNLSNLMRYKSSGSLRNKYLYDYLFMNQFYRTFVIILDANGEAENALQLSVDSIKAIQGMMKFYIEPMKEAKLETPKAKKVYLALTGIKTILIIAPHASEIFDLVPLNRKHKALSVERKRLDVENPFDVEQRKLS